MARSVSRLASVALVLTAMSQPGLAADLVQIGHFSKAAAGGDPPSGWRPQALRDTERQTRFSLVERDGKIVLQAEANASVAGLAYALRADPLHTPWLEWTWRVDSIVQKGDILTKEGDDYAARVYVLFDYNVSRLPFGERAKIGMARALYGADLPIASLCYVWDNRQPVGFSTWSAYTKRLRMIVAASGSAKAGKWLRASRNVADDFRAAFGEEAPPIKAIVVASDTDNTGETVRAYFGDIDLRQTPSE